ncbi:MAG: hypothetical protein J5959_17450 [Butyrivibrio sp.]|jgi:hypothetical protein|nr:hypothetical protein [Butyrivibrio sp.]
MGLFGKSKEDKKRDEIKGKVESLMNQYDKEEIDGPTYIEKMMALGEHYSKKKKK